MKSLLDMLKSAHEYDLIEDTHIYTRPILNLILAALLQPSFLNSEENKPRLNNEDLLKLSRTRFSDDFLIRVIEVYENDFELSRKSLLRFRRSGVGEKVIEALLSEVRVAPVSGAAQDLLEFCCWDL